MTEISADPSACQNSAEPQFEQKPRCASSLDLYQRTASVPSTESAARATLTAA
jgi:hypothetical protein